jgi:hypothetical protein
MNHGTMTKSDTTYGSSTSTTSKSRRHTRLD